MSTRTSMIAAILASGVALPALAQQNEQGRQTAGVEGCDRLMELVSENEDRFRNEWIDHARSAAQDGDRQECRDLVAQGEKAAAELDRRQQAEAGRSGQRDGERQQAQAGQDGATGGRIIVQQPEPSVRVQQDSPEITYSQPRPSVSVQQGQPEIIVRQRKPTVRVQVPRPTITIDQPQPEIIVRMPEPEVDVSMPEPDIRVSQDRPEVAVSQPKPQVDVEMDRPEVNVQEGDRAQVSVENSEPVVRRDGEQQQAEVNVDRGQPQIRYEAAEPEVQFEMTGEPQVTFNRSGEPDIRVERMDGKHGQQAAAEGRDDQGKQQQAAADQQQNRGQQARADQQQNRGQQAAADQQQNREQQAQAPRQETGQDETDPQQTATVDREGSTEQLRARVRGDTAAHGESAGVQVSSLLDRQVVNRRGEELGEVERVVMVDDRAYLVLAHGGFLGLGEDEVGLPLDRITALRGDDRLVLRGLTEDEIEAMPDWDPERARELGESEQVEIDSADA